MSYVKRALTRNRISRALDVPYSDDTSITVTSLFGGAVNLGTGGVANLTYERLGRTIKGQVNIVVGTSPSVGSGPWYIANTELPAVPVTPYGTTGDPGCYGAVYSSSLAMLETAIPIIANVGSIAMVFFTPPGDGGLGNLLTPVLPIPIGSGATVVGQFLYEAASAE